MFARLPSIRKAVARIIAVMSFFWLTACDPLTMTGTNGNTGQRINPNAPVQVALLVPGESVAGTDGLLAANLENAARLAIADLNGVNIDLRVYNTGANPALAGAVASQAVADGAKIILGPLFAEAANAVGLAVAKQNINVLAFSNNTAIAGGNVFVLGATFQNTANRLVQFSLRQGINRYAVVHGADVAGEAGRDAITTAIRNNGGQVSSVESYPLSQQGIVSSARRIAESTLSGEADAVFMTAGVNADLPIVATALPEAGIDPSITRYIGLTRWSAAPQALALPGLQDGLFTLPNQDMQNLFSSRYEAAFGDIPHPLAGLAYDGIAAIGALVADGNSKALTKQSLTSPQGFQGTAGIFRLLPNGQNERGLAVATVRNNSVFVLEAAPRSFGRAGF